MLISKEQYWRSPPKKLEEEKRAEITGPAKKTPRLGKTKTYFDKPSLRLKRILLTDQENVFLFKFELTEPVVLKCLFWHNLCRGSLLTWREVIPIYSFSLQSKIFLIYIMQNILAKYRILKNFRNTESFLWFWHLQFQFVQISRNLGAFCKLKNVLYFKK